MLGHRLFLSLKDDHDVRFTYRSAKTDAERDFVQNHSLHSIENIDVTDTIRLEEEIKKFQPTLVINCTGVIEKETIKNQPHLAYSINSVFPHKAAALGLKHQYRFIHISTDCIFDGESGNYKEDSPVKPEGDYAISKQLGEVTQMENTLTIRASIIGRELGRNKSLVEWFLNNSKVGGYENVFFSGLPTFTLSKIIIHDLIPSMDLYGLIHISSNKISKLKLLELINEKYKLGKLINPTIGPELNRHLNSEYYSKIFSKKVPDWNEIITDLLLDDPLYS
jgi:dTDP-4-dehydrorhamnose reductase